MRIHYAVDHATDSLLCQCSVLVKTMPLSIIDGRRHGSGSGRLVPADSGLFGGQSSGLMKSGVTADSSASVSRARWAGALSCWKVKKSPETERMADRKEVSCIGN